MICNDYKQPYVTLEDAEIQKMIEKAKAAGEEPLIRILSNIAIVTLGRRAPIYINAELLPDIVVNVETGEYYTDAEVVGPNCIIFLVPKNIEAKSALLQLENWSNTTQMQCVGIEHVKDNIYFAVFGGGQVTCINNSEITKNVRAMVFPKNVSSATGFDNNPYLEKLVLNDELLILEHGFAAKSTLKEIKFAKGLLRINDSLMRTSLRSIMLPEGLESINAAAFVNCVNLERIYIPNTVKNIGSYAFKSTGLKQLVLPSSISTIYFQLIADTPIKTLVIPKSVIEICDGGLADTHLEKLIFEGDAPIYDGEDLLSGCSCENTAIYVPDKYYNNYYKLLYETNTLKHAHLIAYKLEEKAEIQPNNEIWYTTTDNLIIDDEPWNGYIGRSKVVSHTYSNNKGIIKCENDITAILEYTFEYIETLRTLYLPTSINTILGSAIYNCTYMTDLYYNGTIEQWNTISLSDGWHYYTPISVVHCLDGDVNV